ncbi:response regulator [Geomonas sp. RF6]|uniref:response regulator n=1 Tax=Geomonas sp. RF6 TaxID=2897342 RepID=UPI001E41BE03|nr:response regulator [Geomonas sp. RF6]UFS72514.1 response regulator [Geomonas sp. RF6]
MRMLIVEDDATMQHLMATIMSRQGISCAVVNDGQSAVEAWEREGFDVIFMDIQMPVLDGLEATRIIRRREAGRGGHTIIIATTAFATDADREMCLKAGMDDYMSKPIDLEKLFALVDKHRELHNPSLH